MGFVDFSWKLSRHKLETPDFLPGFRDKKMTEHLQYSLDFEKDDKAFTALYSPSVYTGTVRAFIVLSPRTLFIYLCVGI